MYSQPPLRLRGVALRLILVWLGATLAIGLSAPRGTRWMGVAALASFVVGLWLLRPAWRAFEELSERLSVSAAELERQRSATLDANRRLRAQNEALRRANEVLAQLSVTDGLTRLHNHRHFQDQFAREAKRADRTHQPLALALVDIDDFKRLNDDLGHAAGDAVLQGVSRLMAQELRETDFLSRYGGEEFALLAPQTDLGGATALAEKLRLTIAAAELPVVGPHGRVSVTVSIGVSLYDGSTSSTFEAADRALYEAKAAGKDCVIARRGRA